MNIQWLREHLVHLEKQLVDVKQTQAQLHVFYQQSRLYAHDEATQSRVLESYFTQLDRQQQTIDRVTELHHKASNHLSTLESGRS